MHVILWRFRARPGRESEFEAAYGGDGAWARFFKGADGYLGTELMRGTDGVYLTVDRWVSAEAYRVFRETHAQRYAELDAHCAELTIEETALGAIGI
jgi:heme-degrading monooxygenase HmoA